MNDTVETRRFRWGFASSGAVIVLLVIVGQVLGNVSSPMWSRLAEGGIGAVFSGMTWRDGLFLGAIFCAAIYVVLQREPILRFFRSMCTGVMLVGLSLFAVALGVLVPQMEGFEDPDARIPSVSDVPAETLDTYLRARKTAGDDFARKHPKDNPVLASLSADQVARAKGYRQQLDQFKFAEAYFVYHLLHPYGLGAETNPLPPQVVGKLEDFGKRYGKEERDNREKQMKQAFSGMPKSTAIAELTVKHHDGFRRAFDVCTALHFNRTYKSNWFASLLGLLCIGVGLNSFRGRPIEWLSARKVGWIVVHVGIMVLLVGGAYSKLRTHRGILHLDLSEGPKNEYWGWHQAQNRTQMPFYVKLDRFARKDWPTLQVAFHADDFQSRLPEYTLWPGRTFGLDWVQDPGAEQARPSLRFHVRELAERAAIKSPRLWEAERRDDPAGIGAVVELGLLGDGGGERPVLLKPDSPSDLYFDASWTSRVRAVYDDDAAKVEGLLRESEPGHLGVLDIGIDVQGHVEPQRREIALGRPIVLDDYKITPVEATANFSLDATGKTEVRDSRPLSEQPPRSPGVWVNIEKQGDDTPERRLVLQSLDAQTHAELQGRYRFKDVTLRLSWDAWGVEGPPRFVLQWGPKTPPRLIDSAGVRHELTLGAALPLPHGGGLTLSRLFHNARFEKTIEFLAPHLEGPHFDESFYSHDPVGLELEITSQPGTAAEKTEVVRMASTDSGMADLWQSPDQSYYVRFYENQAGFPFEWRSVLSIWEDDGKGGLRQVDAGAEHDREIRVNDYFHYRGYRFFQTNADPEFPTYSGIGVVYDPGIPIVLYGMYTIIVGTILAFILRPIAQARQASKAARASKEVTS